MQPIKTVLCSYGMSGKVFHAPFLQMLPGFELYGAWERSRQLIQADYPFTRSFPEYDTMLADGEVELVIVNTPNATHFEYAKKALQAGKHVIIEKPFTVKSDEGDELAHIAKEKGLLLSAFQNRRYDSDLKTVKQVVDSGKLGKIVEAEFHFDRYREEISPKAHKETPGPGVGALYDLGAHIIDQALYLFGMPNAVFADICAMRKVSKVDDYFDVLLFYKELRVRLKGSYLVKEPVPSYILHGTKGSFLKSRADVQETNLQAGIIPGNSDWGMEPDTEKGLLNIVTDAGNDIREYIVSEQGNYGEYYISVYNAIRNQAAIAVTASDGINVIRIIEAAFESNRTGAKVFL